MEAELSKTYSPEDLANNIPGDLYLIKANMDNVDTMVGMFVRDHENKLVYDKKAITKAVTFYQTYYDVRTEIINGHWACLALKGREAYFFDSLGIFPDDELNRINPLAQRINCTHGRRNIGIALYNLSQRGYKIHYNPSVLQEDTPFINTCGRYCILFLNNAIRFSDPYLHLKEILIPFKKNEKYWDRAIVRYMHQMQ